MTDLIAQACGQLGDPTAMARRIKWLEDALAAANARIAQLEAARYPGPGLKRAPSEAEVWEKTYDDSGAVNLVHRPW